MALFSLLTLELILFMGCMLLYTTIRKQRCLPLLVIRDVAVYMVPSIQDFQVLEESCIGPNGKKLKKYNSKARFPMRTLPLNEEALEICREYFNDFDFIQMLFMLVVVMIGCMTIVKVAAPELGLTNLSLYLGLLTLALLI